MAQKKNALVSPNSGLVGAGTCWLGDQAVFGFGNGKLLIDGKSFSPHKNGIFALLSANSSHQIISIGGDGAVVATNSEGQSEILFHDPRLWIDTLAYDAQNHVLAVGAGQDVLFMSLNQTGISPTKVKPARAPTSLAFSGDGKLLAIGHSAGVSLVKMEQSDTVLREFPCSGGPLSVALDHSGHFLFAGLSEPALAGWRLSDGQGFRMGGYPGKPRQLVWGTSEKALLTSGGPALLVWPMMDKGGHKVVGPMGQAAGVYRPRLGMLTAVATLNNIAVTGWSDGGVDLVDLISGETRHIGGPRPPKDLDKDPRALTAGIVSVALRGDGHQVSWISETGAYGTAAVQ